MDNRNIIEKDNVSLTIRESARNGKEVDGKA